MEDYFLIGIDHSVASLQTREHAYRLRKDIIDFCQQNIPASVALLLTCNRIEIYGFSREGISSVDICSLIKDRFPEVFTPAYYLSGEKNILHYALRLACGLQSQIILEPQIIDQLIAWIGKEDFPKEIYSLWQKVINVAIQLRKRIGDCSLGANLASFVYAELEEIMAMNGQCSLGIVGTGKIAQLFAKKTSSRYSLEFFARKKHAKAKIMASFAGGEVHLMAELKQRINHLDVLICATASSHSVIKANYILPRKKELIIYDLSFPRDVSFEVKAIKGVTVKNLNDLNFLMTRENNKRKPLSDRISAMIPQAVEGVSGRGLCWNY